MLQATQHREGVVSARVTDKHSRDLRRATLGPDAGVLLVAGGLLLTIWSIVIPIFEAPDEFLHWQYARHLHDTWRLPVYGPLFAEANSPPLYYAAIAPVAQRSDVPPPLYWFDGRDEFVPFAAPRLYMNARDDLTRYGPIRRARLLTALMSIATTWFCVLAALEVTGRASTALLAGGFVTFLPQFAFRGMNVSNDALVTTMAAWLLYLLLRLIRRGFTWRIGLLGAVALAGAYLSKINAIALAPAFALAILSERSPWRTRIAHLGVLAVTLLLVAPWSVRNLWLYGDPFASAKMYEAVHGMIVERSLWDWHHVTTLPREVFKSFVGYFGYLSVKLPKWTYALYLVAIVVPLVGLLRPFARKLTLQEPIDSTYVRTLLVLGAIIVCSYAVVVRINLQFSQSQGRYMFPALPALVVAMAVGLEHWRPWRAARTLWPARGTVAAWGAANVAILCWIVVPAYYPPMVPTRSDAHASIGPSVVRDLRPEPDGRFAITGPRPELAADVRLPAADSRFVIFDLEGRAPVREMTGAVILTLDNASASEEVASADRPADVTTTRTVRLPFRWLADGKRRTIYLTTLREPQWEGTVAEVSIRPVEEAGNAGAATVLVKDIRLVGAIPGDMY
jgi:hypothetical protein